MSRILLVFYLMLLIGCKSSVDYSAPGFVRPNAMVVSAHPLASQVGREILQKGGNAVDAAIAVQFALAVVHPSAGNLGGGGFMVIRQADGTVHSLDFREMAPAAAHRDMYLDERGDVIENLSLRGHLASGVPGSVDGMVKAYEKFGTMNWEELVQPAIDIARNGHILTEKEANGLNWIQQWLKETNTVLPEQFIGEWKKGDKVYNEDLAQTLERVQQQKRDGFYMGQTAALIAKEMSRGNGIITLNDLADYRSVWRTPVEGHYRGYHIISMPPPSSGGIALLQLLKMTEPYPVRDWGFQDPRTIHLMTEAERRVYADRATHLGDPDFYNVPAHTLLHDDYLRSRMADYDENKATRSEMTAAGEVYQESEQTTHFSIVDAAGNAVAVTTTLNGSYGSKLVIGDAGFFMNNEMDDFSIKAGEPNMFGLIGGEANAIEGGKRMLSSMTPTIVAHEGELFMVTGTPGGATIITSVYQNLLNVIDHGMSMQGAVSAPRFHHQWLPEKTFYEEGTIPPATIKKLESMGHTFGTRGSIGRVDAILRLKDGTLEGGADPRGDDAADGY